MTDVFEVIQTNDVLNTDFNEDAFADELFASFKQKEENEINRISQMIAFFESSDCLSLKLARYFGDQRQTEPCGHCSACLTRHQGTETITTLPFELRLPSLSTLNPDALCKDLLETTDEPLSHDMQTRFLCGISNPLFVRIKARNLPSFGKLEQYRYQDVRSWLASSV